MRFRRCIVRMHVMHHARDVMHRAREVMHHAREVMLR